MKINDNTKISELIRANKSCIDAIAGVAAPFHRLRNPILRKIMASRVTIAGAARMGGCTVNDIVAALIPLGFEYEKTVPAENDAVQPRPQWLVQAEAGAVFHYDVRPIIASGTDPLKAILAKFKETPAGGILCIINSFVPTPLIHLLKQDKAEDSYVDMISEKEWHTYFLKKRKESTTENKSGDKVIMDDMHSFRAVYDSFPREKVKETDVRHMEMPVPMQTILGELSLLPADGMLYVHHKRIPVYLLEELADKNYEVHIHTLDDNNVKMILFEKQ